MSKDRKQPSNPFSTGGGGAHFEAHVQATFVALMLTGGYAPCLPCWPIKKIRLQGKSAGYNTDDVIVFVENPGTGEQCKLLGQIKRSINITKNDETFGEVIKAAWGDFNNPEVFIKGRDRFALITGPLNVTDTKDTRTVLEWARSLDNADEFFKNIDLAKVSNDGKRTKLEAFKTNIKKANDDNDVEDKTIYAFLKHFHLLGFDLDIKSGVTLALMHSLIGQSSRDNAAYIWTQLVDEVQSTNKNAGTITPEKLPEDLKEAFKQPAFAQIPKELTVPPSETAETWSQHQYANALALANLVGAWHDKNEADISIMSQITTENYSDWIAKIRDIIQGYDSPISLQNGIWKVDKRSSLWTALGSRIFDEHLDTFKKLIVAILTERNPSFYLPTEELYAAIVDGKVLTHSPALRKGLAEGLALLGSRASELINCSHGKAERTAELAIREILADADWVLWGSLNSLLPILAEAAPNEFLHAVEKALLLSPCPFDELFSGEDDGITGGNYLTGLLWALEGLAWDEKYFVQVCLALGELASHDPGGKWANRPANSLSTILLPWRPQTMASIEKRKVAVQTLSKELPDITWRLIINLLPNQRQTSMGSHKPSWRNPIPDDREQVVTHQEYWEQISFYAELAVSMASQDNSRLGELIDHFDNLPKPSFDRLLEVLSSDAITGLPENERLPLWDRLTKFTSEHRRFSDAKWALNSDLLSAIEAVSDKLAPSNPLNLYQHLFSDRDWELYEKNVNLDEQRKKLDDRRQKAIREILNIGGLNLVIEFAEAVNSPSHVGYSIGCIAERQIDEVLLPAYLETENRKLSFFASGYVRSRHDTNGWSWADGLDKSKWSAGQIGRFLSCLPFTKETWDRTAEWLGESQGEYWAKTNANPYQAKGDLSIAIDKLLEQGRPHAAINCLYIMRYRKQPIDVAQIVNALLAAFSSPEPSSSRDAYKIVELVKILQETPEVSPDDLFRVEWAYLPLLDRHCGATPKLLESRLAGDPDFFCEVIRLIYRSKKNDKIADEPSEDRKAMATNARQLLHEWRTPPGMQSDGSFKNDEFSSWLQRVKEVCTESGHLEVALTHIGQVLTHCPADPDGLWIDRTVADALNSRDSEKMRNGYQQEFLNSRGFYLVDPTGKQERELAEKYRKMADEVENEGYQRLAVTLKGLSEYYDREAERIVAEHKGDDYDNEC